MQREEEQLTRKNTTVWSLMCQAVKKGDYESMKKILMTEKIRDQNCTGETVLSESPLHLAIAQGKDTFVDLLIENGIDISCTNLYGETPLHTACSSGNLEIAQKLLAAGSMLDCKDCGECTPLFHAVHANKPHVVKYLIHEGANLDTLNEELLSPLDHAILYNRKEIIGLLLKGGCALDKTEGLVYYPGHYSNSVLFSLWIDGDLDNVKILLEAGYKVTSAHLTTLFNVAKSLHWDDTLLHTVKSIVREPMTLKSTCRIAIRKHIMNLKCSKNQSVQGMISLLPLPDILKTFVRMM